MGVGFVKALEDEIAGLEAALKADPRIQKLEDAKRLLARYTDRPEINPHARIRQAAVPRPAARNPVNQAILDCAGEFIAGRAYPTPTIDIFDHVRSRMDIPGTNPKNNLSAMLSNSTRFQANGRAGWTLSVDEQEASDTLFTATSEAPNSIAASLTAEPNVKPVDPALGGGA